MEKPLKKIVCETKFSQPFEQFLNVDKVFFFRSRL